MKQDIIVKILVLLSILIACEKSGVNETVETSNILLPLEDLPYKFSRQGISSVDYYKVEIISESIDLLKKRFKDGSLQSDFFYKKFMQVYNQGISYIKPVNEIANSPIAKTEKVKQDVSDMIEYARTISKQRASSGKSGYIGAKVGYSEKILVDDKGIAVAEVFSKILDGAIYLDKMLNYHLDERFFNNKELREKHENVIILPGQTYTELEHHWDMAYGYFKQIQWMVQTNDIAELIGVERKIVNAFVLGRTELGNFRYDELMKYLRIIRQEISRVFAIKTINALAGITTEVNFKEDPTQAFKYISQGYGMIYALQFTRKKDGSQYLTYEQSKQILEKLIKDKGLWSVIKLSSNENTDGSLKNIAKQIQNIFLLR